MGTLELNELKTVAFWRFCGQFTSKTDQQTKRNKCTLDMDTADQKWLSSKQKRRSMQYVHKAHAMDSWKTIFIQYFVLCTHGRYGWKSSFIFCVHT
jgi:hypothetical protein